MLNVSSTRNMFNNPIDQSIPAVIRASTESSTDRRKHWNRLKLPSNSSVNGIDLNVCHAKKMQLIISVLFFLQIKFSSKRWMKWSQWKGKLFIMFLLFFFLKFSVFLFLELRSAAKIHFTVRPSFNWLHYNRDTLRIACCNHLIDQRKTLKLSWVILRPCA